MTACYAITAAACSDLGYSGVRIYGSGIDTTDSEVASAAVKAVARQRQRFPLVCGASPKQEARRNRQLAKAVEMDAKRMLGIGIMVVVMSIIGGPLAAVLVIIGAVLSWMIERELQDHWQAMYAAAQMEIM